MDPAASAPLLCAGITTYSPLRQVGLKKGARVAVMGLGGLGHMGVKLAASFGAEVTILSRSAQKEADAKRLGAHEFVLTNKEGALEKLTGRYDTILDTISAKHDINGPLNCLKPEGTLILVGGIPETQEMLDHCGKHGITSDIEMTTPDYERTLKGDVKYRFVIDCARF